MRNITVWVAMSCCAASIAMPGSAQNARKPGLWEVNSKMTWQLSPIPPGVTLPGGISPSTPTTHTTQVCLTQEMIDRYGAPIPQSRSECRAENIRKTASAMSADWVCSGRMSGKGTLESSWIGDTDAQSKLHFVGTMQMGQGEEPVEWTNESTSVYKGSDCGDLKPVPTSKSAGQKAPGK